MSEVELCPVCGLRPDEVTRLESELREAQQLLAGREELRQQAESALSAERTARAEFREGLALALSDVSISPDGNSYARLTETTYRRLRALLEGK